MDYPWCEPKTYRNSCQKLHTFLQFSDMNFLTVSHRWGVGWGEMRWPVVEQSCKWSWNKPVPKYRCTGMICCDRLTVDIGTQLRFYFLHLTGRRHSYGRFCTVTIMSIVCRWIVDQLVHALVILSPSHNMCLVRIHRSAVGTMVLTLLTIRMRMIGQVARSLSIALSRNVIVQLWVPCALNRCTTMSRAVRRAAGVVLYI